MKNKLFLAVALVVALIATSCNNNNDAVVTQSLPGCYANIVDKETGESTLLADLTVGLTINYSKGNSEIELSGLKLPNGTSYPTVKISDQSITQKDGWYIIENKAPLADTGSSNYTPTLENLSFRLLERTIILNAGANYSPGLAVSFDINSKYTVYISRTINYLAGTTRVSGVQSFETKEPIYGFGFDANKQLMEMALINCRFIEGMPKLNFSLRNIPFKCTGSVVTFSIDKVIPFVGNTPNEGYPITNLSGTFDPINGFNVSFDCSPSSVPGATFRVVAAGTYTDVPSSED